jgi:hypothetical protein
MSLRSSRGEMPVQLEGFEFEHHAHAVSPKLMEDAVLQVWLDRSFTGPLEE